MPDTFLPPIVVGSTDWAGGAAPSGGSHTGQATVTMNDGLTFQVAHNRAEVLRKMDVHASPPVLPAWVAFDQPNSAIPVVLDIGSVRSVA